MFQNWKLTMTKVFWVNINFIKLVSIESIWPEIDITYSGVGTRGPGATATPTVGEISEKLF